MVRANLEAMADVVTVLLDNALKYSDEKTTVTIHSELRGRTAILSVTDQGHGIEGDDLPRIFDRFYRVDGSRSRQHVEGHGLGLSIAKRIVDQHGGQLNVQSEPGRGATFSIRLLLAS